MKIVLDTNIVISGLFFGGIPRTIMEAVVNNKFQTYASKSIIDEYNEIVEEMIDNKKGSLSKYILKPFIKKLKVISPSSKINISRDKDDNKFIECAIDAKATIIVSGDNDLLDLKKYKDINILTARQFYNKYLV